MINDEDVLSINFLKKQNYTGSYRGMRYILMKKTVKDEDDKEENFLTAAIWPQPMNYENSSPESRTEKTFSFTNEGRKEAIEWLNASYESGREIWDRAGF